MSTRRPALEPAPGRLGPLGQAVPLRSFEGYADQNRVIVVIVTSTREVEAIRGLLRTARRRFRQEAMYLEYHRVFFEEVR
jgi:hypothetical protein